MNKYLKILIYLAIGLIVIQFIGIDKSAPKLEGYLDFIEVELPPEHIVSLIKTSCYDCHSYKTNYPWYSNISPISWSIGSHITEGRAHLNFSTWGEYDAEVKKDLLFKCYKQIGARQMPLPSYLLLHDEAKINKEQIEEFYTWFKNQSENIKL
jgi:hypothetical protein